MSLNFILSGPSNQTAAFVDTYGFKVIPAIGDEYTFAVHGATGSTEVKGRLDVAGVAFFKESIDAVGQITASVVLATGGVVSNSGYQDANAKQVVGNQQPAVPNAEPTVESLTAALNALLGALRTHGLIDG